MYIEDTKNEDVCIKFRRQKHCIVKSWSNKTTNVKESKSVQKDLVTRMPDKYISRYNALCEHFRVSKSLE